MRQEEERQTGLLTWLAAAIDPHSGIPVSVQLQQAFERAIDRGVLRPGDTLPTIRTLATHLRLAPNTVSKAYASLQRSGRTENRAGAGTSVLGRGALTDDLTELRTLLGALRLSGVSASEAHAVVDDVWHEPATSRRVQ